MRIEAGTGVEADKDSAARRDSTIATDAGAAPARAWQSLKLDTLRKTWHAAAHPSNGALPPFEELSLECPRGVAQNVALLQAGEDGEPVILDSGNAFEAWLGRQAANLKVGDLSIDRARALRELYDRALREGRPVQRVAYGVVDGLVCVYDLVAAPLSSREGRPPCMLYIQERAKNFSLVEAIFQSTDEGLVALTVIRDASGVPYDFEIAALNEGAAAIMQSTVEELRGRRLSDVSEGLKAQDIFSRIIAIFNKGGRARFELACPLDAFKHLRIGVVTMGDLVAMTLSDISALKAQEASFRLLFEANPVPMWVHSLDDLRFLAVNEAAVAQYGFPKETFLEMTLLDIVPGERQDVVRQDIRNGIKAEGDWSRPSRHVKADGSILDVYTSWCPILFHGERAQLAAAMDVTEKRRAEARLAHMARHDPLTDLANRALFHERLNEALVRVRRDKEKLAVLCLDLDRFKNVNDTLGHTAGDKLLMALAERLRACVRDGDTVARFGGDEFAILQTAIADPRDASALAERIIKLLSESYEIDGQQILSGASVGIALAPNDGDTCELLLRHADLALYRAKQDGRRTFRFFEYAMDITARARHSLERDLRNALALGELELQYQPLVSLSTGAISGFEALLRWNNPERGSVPPSAFIPIAEDTGLIVPIGEWVLRQACAEAAKWPANVKVAVNLSPVQFKKENLPQIVFAALVSAGLPAERLELEITESILLEESKTNLATLRRLHTFGVSISMDDFGTGYSSLAYLRSFHFDRIKIDRSFVSELGDNAECLAIVRTIAKLAADLGIPTIAEGVETEAQRELLRKEGCTEMQGYLFSKPIPASEVARLLSGKRCTAKSKKYRLSA